MLESIKVPSSNEAVPLEIQVPFKIDDIPCQLIIRKYADKKVDGAIVPYEYCITNRTPNRNPYETLHTSNIEEMMRDLYAWSHAKYMGRIRNIRCYASFMKQHDFERYLITRRAMHAIITHSIKTKKGEQEEEQETHVITECYACYQDTLGHQTVCGHDICPKCFHQSLVNMEMDEELDVYGVPERSDMMYSPRTKFTCGVCRTVETPYL